MKWTKHTYVCGNCDSLLEITTTHMDLDITCVCAEPELLLLSVEDATINNNNEQKEEAPMNVTTEYVDTTILALQEAIAKKDEYIYRLQDEISQKSQLVATVRSEMQNFRNTAKEYIVEAISERSMTHEVAETLAQILDIELTKTVIVTATVDFEMELEVPFDTDADDVANNIEFSADAFDFSIDDISLDVISLNAEDRIS